MSNIIQLVNQSVQGALAQCADANLQPEQLAVTLVDLSNPRSPRRAGYREDALIYPASVIKLFYLVAAHQWMEEGKLADTAELRRAMRDMIVDSYNEATGYVIDLLTGTTSGPELPEAEIAQWHDKRNAVNRYFASLGYERINVNKKPWGEGPYGRETQAINLFQPNRNWLTTAAAARLMSDIALGRAVTPERSRQMMELLARDPFSPSADQDNQARAFIGMIAAPGMKLWSKAGWTSQNRHDCAYIELPNGAKFVLVIFTEGHSSERQIIPAVARTIIEGMSAPGPADAA